MCVLSSLLVRDSVAISLFLYSTACFHSFLSLMLDFLFFLPFSSKMYLFFLCLSRLCYLCYFVIANTSFLPYILNDCITVSTYELSVTKLPLCSVYSCVLAMSSALRSEIYLTFLILREQITGVLPFILRVWWKSRCTLVIWLIVANELQ